MQITHNRQVKFKDPVSSSELYGAAAEGQHNENEDTGTWGLGTSPYSNTLEDQNSSYSRYLQPVPEEPSSSFSEGISFAVFLQVTCLVYGGAYVHSLSHRYMQLLMMTHYQQ